VAVTAPITPADRPVARPAPAGAATTGPALPDGGPGQDAVRAAGALIDPIGLPDLLGLAELQTRVDRKYFVPAAAFTTFAGLMAADLRVLDIEGRRSFGYESVYFDTPQWTTYRAHVQGRRRRYKVRTRTYTDSGQCLLEVKLEGRRGTTVKHRTAHPLDERHTLAAPARHHLAALLRTALDLPLPAALGPVLTTHYRRSTFVSTREGARLTCDVALRCSDGRREVHAAADHVLVESKSAARGGSSADRILRDMGIRPARISKYCVGVAALHPAMPSNPWHPVLRRYFGWHPQPARPTEPA
jgi:hypothetical protein